MTIGEKRSLSSSLKKYAPLFIDEINGDFLSFETKEAFINAFYSYWIKQSNQAKLAWVKTTPYPSEQGFKEEMDKKIQVIFEDEIKLFDKKESFNSPFHSLAPLRSKKKRLRKKREKILHTQY